MEKARIIALALLVCGVHASAETADVGGSSADVEEASEFEIEFRNCPIGEVVDFFREQSHSSNIGGFPVNIIVDPGVNPSTVVNLKVRNIPLGQVFACVIDQAGLSFSREKFAFIILSRESGNVLPNGFPSVLPEPGKGTGDYAARTRNIVVDRLEFIDASLESVIHYLADRSIDLDSKGKGINLILSHDVDPDLFVTLDLNRIPLSTVLTSICEMTDLEIRITPYAIFFDPIGTREMALARNGVSSSPDNGRSRNRSTDGSRSQGASVIGGGLTDSAYKLVDGKRVLSNDIPKASGVALRSYGSIGSAYITVNGKRVKSTRIPKANKSAGLKTKEL